MKSYGSYFLSFICLIPLVTFSLESTTHTESETSIVFKNNQLPIDEYSFIFDKILKNVFTDFLKKNEGYYITKTKHDFIFKDEFYDTKDYELKLKDTYLRLRHRYKLETNKTISISDFLSQKRPIRVEMQYKKIISYENNLIHAKEKRIDITNEGPEEILHGRLLSDLGLSKDLLLTNFIKIFSLRRRYHINKKTIYGTGENPNHIFLVTLDYSFSYKNGVVSKPNIEIEVEIERNIRKTLDKKKLHLITKTLLHKTKHLSDHIRELIFKEGLTTYYSKKPKILLLEQ